MQVGAGDICELSGPGGGVALDVAGLYMHELALEIGL